MNEGLTEHLELLDRGQMPRHVGVIMDGNGRWAQLKGLSRVEGHRSGVERVREMIPFAARELKLEILTLYVFSIENWKRPQDEIDALMILLEYFLRDELPSLIGDRIRFRTCGDIEKLPTNLQDLVREGIEKTRNCDGMILNAALSYGGRDEIVRAVRRIASSGAAAEEISEQTLNQSMDTAGLLEPDLIIRTSGEYRMSNFLLWQAAYSELYFTETLWPDFSSLEFVKAVLDYQRRERRYGALPAWKR